VRSNYSEGSSGLCTWLSEQRGQQECSDLTDFPYPDSDLPLSSAARFNLDQLSKSVSAIQKTITDKKKKGEDAATEIAEAEKQKQGKPALEKAEEAAKAALDAALHKIGNIVHQSVPVSRDEVRSPYMAKFEAALAECFVSILPIFGHRPFLSPSNDRPSQAWSLR